MIAPLARLTICNSFEKFCSVCRFRRGPFDHGVSARQISLLSKSQIDKLSRISKETFHADFP